jgi:hypothetical protein
MIELRKILRRIYERGDVPDDEVFDAIRSIPRHETAHRIQQDESLAPWQFPDPTMPFGNTTIGAGMLPFTFNAQIALQEVNATTVEIRTLPDPVKAFIQLGITLLARNGQNLVVRCNTPIWIGTTVVNPVITQNGQFITFGAVNHSIFLSSVPCTRTSFVGTQATVTNLTGARWMVVNTDGPTVT